MPDPPLPPFRFQRHFVEKVWGGRRLAERPGLPLPPDAPIGETWEVVDREHENSRVVGGAFDGWTLHELMQKHGAAILGDSPGRADGRFPLLVKFLDASDDLSVQVHPDDALAATLGGDAEGKTEAWYVVDAEPSGAVYAGLRGGYDAERFREIADSAEVEEALVRHDVRAGDCVLIEGGTVHAIGAGVTILEVQQNSDTTYRLWDWGRVGLDGTPRETHVDAGLACVRFGAEVPQPRPSGDATREELVRSSHFTMTKHRVAERLRLPDDARFRIHVLIAGRGTLIAGENDYPLAPGDTFLVPAAAGAHEVVAEGAELTLLELRGGASR